LSTSAVKREKAGFSCCELSEIWGERMGIMELERDLRLKDLIVSLKNDHKEIRRQLWILRMLISRGDYEVAEKRTLELHTFLGSHFVKEESRARDVLACRPSFSSSFCNTTTATFRKEDEVIESMAQKHKAMSDPFKEIHRITTFLTREEKLSVFDNFERTLLDCLKEEEEKDLVPFLILAIEDERGRNKAQQTRDDKQVSQETKIDADVEKPRGEGKEEQEEELVLA
jgi:hypothetical protein